MNRSHLKLLCLSKKIKAISAKKKKKVKPKTVSVYPKDDRLPSWTGSDLYSTQQFTEKVEGWGGSCSVVVIKASFMSAVKGEQIHQSVSVCISGDAQQISSNRTRCLQLRAV